MHACLFPTGGPLVAALLRARSGLEAKSPPGEVGVGPERRLPRVVAAEERAAGRATAMASSVRRHRGDLRRAADVCGARGLAHGEALVAGAAVLGRRARRVAGG